MRKWRRIHLIPVLLLPLCLVLSSLADGQKETEEVYTIKPGDTLWNISSKLLKDPFLWPKLWQWNPYISNPHLIHPGEPVRLAPAEELKKEEPQKTVAEEKPKEMVREPEVKKVEPPPSVKKPEEVVAVRAVDEKPKAGEEKPTVFPEVRSAGFFSDIDYRGIGIIVESKEGKTLMAEGDIAYLAFKTSEPVLIGNKYTVFRASELVPHPVTGKKIGRRYNITGNIQIIDRYGRFYAAKLIEVFDYVSKGDFIRPYFKEKMEVEQGKK